MFNIILMIISLYFVQHLAKSQAFPLSFHTPLCSYLCGGVEGVLFSFFFYCGGDVCVDRLFVITGFVLSISRVEDVLFFFFLVLIVYLLLLIDNFLVS